MLIDKTDTPEFGLGSHTYSRVYSITRSAWNPERSADGSSGGTAAALAPNMLPVADDSDVMGSLCNPAAWNSIHGLCPSLGHVPYGPTDDMFPQQLGTEDPMARNPQDPVWSLATQAGYGPRAPLLLNDDPACSVQPLHRDFRQIRTGWLGDLGGCLAIDAEVLTANEHVLDTLDTLGCHIETVRPFSAMDTLWECWCTLHALSVSGNLGLLYANTVIRDLLKPKAAWEIEHGRSRTTIDINHAVATWASWCQALL